MLFVRYFLIALVLFPALTFAEINAQKLITSARSQIGVTKSYDPAYRTLSYPGGDVPKETGVCTDVIIRALRQQSLDLQKEVHEDMRANFAAYPKKWRLTKPDRNIDHRRVPNLMTWFKRKGHSLTITQSPLIIFPETSSLGIWVMASPTSASSPTGARSKASPSSSTTSATARRRKTSCSATRSPVITA